MLNGVTVGENHTADYGGCAMRKQVVEIQKVRAEQRMTYAEAVKIGVKTKEWKGWRKQEKQVHQTSRQDL